MRLYGEFAIAHRKIGFAKNPVWLARWLGNAYAGALDIILNFNDVDSCLKGV